MYYGQRETDKYIEDYFPDQNQGFCIEVGAYDGVKGSNTKLFEDKGWDTMCIEPNPYIFPLLKNNRSGVCVEMAVDNFFGMANLEVFDFQSGVQSSLTSLDVDPRLVDDYADAIAKRHKTVVWTTTLSVLLSEYDTPHIDFISIDTEGTELRVLQGLDLERYTPYLLVVENNYEDEEIAEYLEGHGYRFDQRFFVNDFYVRDA